MVMNPGPGMVMNPGPGMVMNPGPGMVMNPGPGMVMVNPGPGMVMNPGPGMVMNPGPGMVMAPWGDSATRSYPRLPGLVNLQHHPLQYLLPRIHRGGFLSQGQRPKVCW
ncbi:tetra-peptide repeat homeobox protein 1-like [Leucoraja erinacea]|uniref:tetra-peptide repeat homeobox protein 1-like n=1 Tax=Leucoraja erinaceus TaxID=7782 RepID=UPI0024543B01|nr:tetra-peptide repeat homeobox protein 1-like [Leucoraja erinacea]